ncbi:dTDP-glucose 4,6-dehydratase [Alphaproteobacteria bacterium]|nr:dTDP-glucose 4,6-dehydratase [Alphaproteobacteria bacterium]
MVFLLTGGAGFIGNALIRHILMQSDHQVVNLDNLTYSSCLFALQDFNENPRYKFIEGDIRDAEVVSSAFDVFQPDVVINLAAESHVDRSIENPRTFIETNIVGTFILLQSSLDYWKGLTGKRKETFRFHHVSTDEVYGYLELNESPFTESTPYNPSSPYAASKASSDHLVRSFNRTYSLPTLLTNCANNYGAFQHPEKFIPNVILRGLNSKEILIYGDGSQIRDWLFVDDHARALLMVAESGVVGETYNIGAHNEITNLTLAQLICEILDDVNSSKSNIYESHAELIQFVRDRPGHDKRYAIDSSKVTKDIGWRPSTPFQVGLRDTVIWYLENQKRISSLVSRTVLTKRLG